jgi:hypothetical protein
VAQAGHDGEVAGSAPKLPGLRVQAAEGTADCARRCRSDHEIAHVLTRACHFRSGVDSATPHRQPGGHHEESLAGAHSRRNPQ